MDHSRPMTTTPVKEHRPSKRTLRILQLIDGSIFHWSATRQKWVLGVGRFHHGSGGVPVHYREYIEVGFRHLQTKHMHATCRQKAIHM